MEKDHEPESLLELIDIIFKDSDLAIYSLYTKLMELNNETTND